MRTLKMGGVREFETLASRIEMQLQRLLEEHNYDTVGNFLEFYDSFKATGKSSVVDFFHKYIPRITPEHHTCVGLALELWHRLRQLEDKYPGIDDYLSVVSCEENIESIYEYTTLSDTFDTEPCTLEKEHVLLCLKFEIAGRSGILLCDPGYHVARVVTVMSDKAYPNTGWFIQSNESGICKEYNYQFSSNKENFVEWQERTTRDGIQETFTGLIYVERPYLTSIDVTERRNLVYTFRSLLSRDQKGHLIAGIYFKVKPNSDEFTIFYQDMGKQRVKMNFSTFQQKEVNEALLKKLSICNNPLNMPEGKLLKIVKRAGELLRDIPYLQGVLAIESTINIMSANN